MPDLEKSISETPAVETEVAAMTISRHTRANAKVEVTILKDKSGKFASKKPKEEKVEEEPLPTTRGMTREARKLLYGSYSAYLAHKDDTDLPIYVKLIYRQIERALDDNPKNALAATKQAEDLLKRWVGAPEPGDSEAERETSQGGNIVVKFDMKDFFPEGVPVAADTTPRRSLKYPSFIDAEVIDINK